MISPSKRVAKKVTKEMEYDYKTGKKSFAGSTAKRDAHAEKEGKIVAKHAAFDKDMDMMRKGGMAKKKPAKKMASGGMSRMPSKGEHPVQKRAKQGAEMIKMAKGGKSKAKKMC